MTKPFAGLSGSSSHLHLSLFDAERNVFWSEEAGDVTSEFRFAIGGVLEHAPALNALLAPTVNCTKRYRKGTYAPASITWGYENRSVAVRIKAGRGAATPYLALAGTLAAVLDGLERRIEPPEPLADSAYQRDDLELLPATLEESLERFETDEALGHAFHPEFVKAFTALQRHEVDKARQAVPHYGSTEWHDEVTDWEREQFLELA